MNRQIDLFDQLYPTFYFEKDKPVRMVELFSGIGFQVMGMQLAEIPYEVIATSEIDKFAIQSYESIHGHNPNLGSITEIHGKDLPLDIDLMTYSFPCTDLSKAGKQKGLNNTRSGLVYEVLRILVELKDIGNLPKVLIMENVVDLVQSKFIKQFNEIQLELEGLGYTNFTEVLNAIDYGVSQNRERVFMVSVLGSYNYNFPKLFESKNTLEDYLESEVDEKYYVDDSKLEALLNGIDRRLERKKTKDPVCLNPKVDNKQPSLQNRVYSTKHPATAITTGFHPKLIEPNNQFSKKSIEKILNNITDVKKHSKTITANPQRPTIDSSTLVVTADGLYLNDSPAFFRGTLKNISRTIKTSDDVGVLEHDLRIRKLTPRETGRLMGMSDSQIDRQQSVMSNSQMYKQHGNGIVAQVIGLIIGMLYYEDEKELRRVVMKNSHNWIKEKTPRGILIECKYCWWKILDTDNYCGKCGQNQKEESRHGPI